MRPNGIGPRGPQGQAGDVGDLPAEFAAHIIDFNNPHEVTAHQLGVGPTNSPTFAGLTVNGPANMGGASGHSYFDASGDLTQRGSNHFLVKRESDGFPLIDVSLTGTATFYDLVSSTNVRSRYFINGSDNGPVSLYTVSSQPVVIGSPSTSLTGNVIDLALPVVMRSRLTGSASGFRIGQEDANGGMWLPYTDGNVYLDSGNDIWMRPGGGVRAGGMRVTTPTAASVPLTIDLASGQTADALQVNSYGGSGGDRFRIDAAGDINAPALNLTRSAGAILSFDPAAAYAEIINNSAGNLHIDNPGDSAYTYFRNGSSYATSLRLNPDGTLCIGGTNLGLANDSGVLRVSDGGSGYGSVKAGPLSVVGGFGSLGQLTIRDTSGTGLSSFHAISFLDSTGALQAHIYKEASSGSLNIINDQSAPVKILTNGSERLVVTPSGHILLGTTSDDGVNLVQVAGSASVQGATNAINSGLTIYPANRSQNMQIGYAQIIASSGIDVRSSSGTAQLGTTDGSATRLFTGGGSKIWSFNGDGSATFPGSVQLASIDTPNTAPTLTANGQVSAWMDESGSPSLLSFAGKDSAGVTSNAMGIKASLFSGNVRFPSGAWQTSSDGYNRFFFSTNGTTFFGTANDYVWRNVLDVNIGSIDSSGNLAMTGGGSFGGNVLISGGIGIGNSASATVAVGTLAKKFEVFDASGASIGFVPVYSSIV